MAIKWIKRILILIVFAGVIGGFVWLMWPQPKLVDVAKVSVGNFEVTVDEEGVNRIREIYVISAPVSGQVGRSPVEVGDKVVASVTPVTTVRPSAPVMIDARTRLQLIASVEAAKAARDAAVSGVAQSERQLQFAETELKKAEYLARKKVIAFTAFERRQFDVDFAKQGVENAKSQLDMRLHDLQIAEAKLVDTPTNAALPDEKECCLALTSPIDGIVLRVMAESEQVVQAGTPLVEVGDPLKSEIAVDLLSSDAVQVKVGSPASIVGWGGNMPLKARVKKIEPSAFTKISALGIEEQRVKTVLEIMEPTERFSGLGHQFRVLVRIVTWQSNDTLQIPTSALFRSNGNWAVFKFENGIAKLTEVTPGHMTADRAEILKGLLEGEKLIVHPSDEIENGTKVEVRN